MTFFNMTSLKSECLFGTTVVTYCVVHCGKHKETTISGLSNQDTSSQNK